MGQQLLVLAFWICVLSLPVIVWLNRKKQIEKTCRENNFTLCKDENFKNNFFNSLQDINIFREKGGLLSLTDTARMRFLTSLNFPDKNAYVAELIHGKDYLTQALILETSKLFPYIKIVKKKMSFFASPEPFYKPCGKFSPTNMNGRHNLYCRPENVQAVSSVFYAVIPHVEKNKLNIEICGQHIVVFKEGVSADIADFAARALPVAQAFADSRELIK